MSSNQKNRDQHICPFNNCQIIYSRAFSLRNHLSKILGQGGNELHPITDPLWKELKEDGRMTIDQRPGNLTDAERKQRRKVSAQRFRNEHADELAAKRKIRTKELQQAAKMAKRAAKIAIHAKRELTKGYRRDRYLVLRKLYDNSSLIGGTDPLSVLDGAASDQTFPLMVCLFLPPNSWPKIVQNDSVPVPRDPELIYPIIEQLPGKKEYQLLQKMLHPDRAPQQNRQISQRGRGRGRGRGGIQIMNGEDMTSGIDMGLSNRDSDFSIKPDGRLNALLNAGWDLWKDVIRSPVVENESFVYLLDDEQVFVSKSDMHKRLIELFATWIHITQQIISSIVPQGYSLIQLHHFVNRYPESPVPDPDFEYDEESSEEDEVSAMHEELLLYKALRLSGKKKPGRHHKQDIEEDSGADE